MSIALRGRFARGIIWNLASAVSTQGSTFLVNIVLARLFGQGGFGAYAVVLGSIQSLSLLAGLAMGYTATRYLAEFRNSDLPRAGRVLGFCLLTAACAGAAGTAGLVGIAPLIAERALHDATLVPLLRVAGVTTLFVIVNGTLMGALAGLEAYRRLGVTNLVAGVLYVVLSLVPAARFGLSGAVEGLLASAIVQSILLGTSLHREVRQQGIRISFREAGAERGILGRFALPSALAGISYATTGWLGQLMLARGPGGYSELAAYVVAFNLVTLVLFLPNLTNTVASSLLNTLVSGDGSPDYRRAFWLNFRVTAITVGAGAIGLMLLGSRILGLYGQSFSATAGAHILLSLGSIPEGLTTAAFQLMQSRARMWHGVQWVIVPRDLIFLSAGALAIPGHGSSGLAAAFLLSRTAGLTLALLMVRSLGVSGGPEDAGDRA